MEWRLFCAFDLPADLRTQLEDHIRHLRETVPHARASWSRPENSHLTVKFFGNVAVEKVEAIKNAAERTAKEFAPIAIEVGEAGVFPNVNRATPRGSSPANIIQAGANYLERANRLPQ
jgi:2'-5' RNA ligase